MAQLIATKIATLAHITPLAHSVEDTYSALLASKHKESTRNTYRLNLKYFAHYMINGMGVKGAKISMSEAEVKTVLAEVLTMDKFTAIAYLSQYQSSLIDAEYTPNTIAVRIASIRAFVRFAFKRGLCDWLVEDLANLGNEVYRDTSGVTPKTFSEILSAIDTDKVGGKRDLAIMRLLWDNGLRRSEISALNISDFNYSEQSLSIKGKGRYGKEKISLSPKTCEAISAWLSCMEREDNQPLFIALDRNSFGHRLTGKSIYSTVRKYSDKVLTDKILSPHRVRHSSITAILDNSNGNVRLAQKFSRHKNLNTLTKYDDNRKELQKEAVNLVAGLV